MNAWSHFCCILKREVLQNIRHRGELINPLIFFVVVVSLFPLATTSSLITLRVIGSGVIWVAALLATLLSLKHLFERDMENGILEQHLLSAYPLALIVFAKALIHWLMFLVPLIVLAPLLGVMFHLSGYAILILVISLFLGTPTLVLLGSMLSALTLGLRGASVLLALLLFPLYIPVLIFANSAVVAVEQGLMPSSELAFLGALLVLALMAAPFVTAAILRLSVQYN